MITRLWRRQEGSGLILLLAFMMLAVPIVTASLGLASTLSVISSKKKGPEPFDSGPPSVGGTPPVLGASGAFPLCLWSDRYGQKGLSGNKENGGWHASIAGLFTTVCPTAL